MKIAFIKGCTTLVFSLVTVLMLVACSDDNALYTAPFAWETTTPAEADMDKKLLEAAFVNAFADGLYTQAAVVVKDGRLVYERYRGATENEYALYHSVYPGARDFDVRDRDSLATSWSMAKSFTSILIGIAVDQGHIKSIEEPAAHYIPEWRGTNTSAITIKNLLDMRSGLVPICPTSDRAALEDCNKDYPSDGGALTFADNQMAACISPRTLIPKMNGADNPFIYSNCDTQLLGQIVFNATKMPVKAFADRHLFSKIGMTAHWWRDNAAGGQMNGHYLTYCCLDATARDYARFGQLILNEGRWGSERIVSADYIRKIRAGLAASPKVWEEMRYGLQFWTLGSAQQDGVAIPEQADVIAATGFDGQYIMIDFNNRLVVVRNSLYHPRLRDRSTRKVRANAVLNNVVGPVTMPALVRRLIGYSTAGYEFQPAIFLYEVTSSLTTKR